mmetsp:Transcript_36332/g.82313  ORF Transcript_36332/g.82313 Transcript_36332/m.82313 type:complete len:668 (-) Transcript_36332:43-2046(-)
MDVGSEDLGAPEWPTNLADLVIAMKTGLVCEEDALRTINAGMVKSISLTVAEAGKPFFRTEVVAKLNMSFGDHIKELQDPYICPYGRVTFFVVFIGAHTLPLFQPGTPMFMSGVHEKCPLEVWAKECTQNGPVLGQGCATFLGEVQSKLAMNYQRICTEKHRDCRTTDPEVFHLALMETLTAYALCDAREHGRLLEMRDTYLSCLKGARDVKVKEGQLQPLFVLKDLAAASTTAKPLEDKEWLQKALLPMRELSRKELQEARVKHMSYPEWEAALKDGAQPAQQLLTTYRDGLMRKKKIVEPDTLAEKIFREAVEEHCENLLKCLGELERLCFGFQHATQDEVCKRIYNEYRQHNDRVREYAHVLKDDLISNLEAASVGCADVFEVKQGKLVGALQGLARELPSVFGLLVESAASTLHKWDEEAVLQKFKKITSLVSQQQRGQLAEDLTRLVTLLRREYVAKLTKMETLLDLVNMPKVEILGKCKAMAEHLGFEKTLPRAPVLLAKLDCHMLLACMLALTKEEVRMLEDAELCEGQRGPHLTLRVYTAFEQAQVRKTTSDPPRADEAIIAYKKPSEALDASLFKEFPNVVIPRMKKREDETLEQWEDRLVNQVLLDLNEEQWGALQNLADPTSPRRQKLDELVNRAGVHRRSPTYFLWCQARSCTHM